jgi:ubiquinone/menaquinone biosynthesis C-methylase UbiE
MSRRTVHHPIFARVFARLSRAEERYLGEYRRELLEGLSGCVLELGAGTGLNFRHYPTGVVAVVAVEPEPYLRRRAEQAASEAPVPVEVVEAVAEALPFEDAAFDAAVASLVLCSVADQALALAELRRVVRPGGELRFYEHVAAEDGLLLGAQRMLDHVWPHLAGGCHCSRDTAGEIARAGFAIERCRRFDFRPCPLALPTAPTIIGVARRPALPG